MSSVRGDCLASLFSCLALCLFSLCSSLFLCTLNSSLCFLCLRSFLFPCSSLACLTHSLYASYPVSTHLSMILSSLSFSLSLFAYLCLVPLFFLQDPSACSEAVWALTSLISPLVFNADFRPYFTIYDPDFKTLSSIQSADLFPSLVLGTTNPLFLRTLDACQNIVILPEDTRRAQDYELATSPLPVPQEAQRGWGAREEREKEARDASLRYASSLVLISLFHLTLWGAVACL